MRQLVHYFKTEMIDTLSWTAFQMITINEFLDSYFPFPTCPCPVDSMGGIPCLFVLDIFPCSHFCLILVSYCILIFKPNSFCIETPSASVAEDIVFMTPMTDERKYQELEGPRIAYSVYVHGHVWISVL